MRVGLVLLGIALGGAVALVARSAGALTNGGAAAAMATGALAVIAGWGWAVILIVYFTTATALSRYRAADKTARTSDLVDKPGARDAMQVVANGGVFAAMALGHALRPDPAWQTLAAGALAASAADTWATEIGVLAAGAPRSILTGRRVPPGTSGAVTLQGMLAGLSGAALIAATAWIARWPAPAIVSAVTGGSLGCLLDSVAGAAFQARRWCPSCSLATEQRVHRCGTRTTRVGGLAWLDNDGVNVIATLGGALLGAAFGALLATPG